MDEPLNGLDQISKREILGCLRRLNRHFSLPTLYVSHDIEEVARLCDHMLVMNAGRVIDQGRTASIIEKLNQNPDQAVSPVGSVIHAKVSGHLTDYSLTELDLAGHKLFAPIQSGALDRPEHAAIFTRTGCRISDTNPSGAEHS